MATSKYQGIQFQDCIERVASILKLYDPVQVSHDGVKKAAVLIPFLNKDNIPYIVFTRRTDWVETHKGQISFPGGMQDPQDKDLLNTAKRETLEEIGIQPENIVDLGQLDDFFTVTDFIITPYVGYLQNNPLYKINHREVAQVIEAPLELFLTDDRFEVKKWEHNNRMYDVYFYYYQDQVIWGATAFILNRFIDTVFEFNPAPNPIRHDPRNSHYLQENRHRKAGT